MDSIDGDLGSTPHIANRSRSDARYTAAMYTIAALSLLAPVAGMAAGEYYDEVKRVAGSSSNTEKVINNGLHRSILAKEAWLNCDASYLQTAEGTRMGYTTVTDIPVLGRVAVMHMPQELCEGVVDYTRSDDKSSFTHEQYYGIETAVHEAVHIQLNELSDKPDEARVTCVQIQMMESFAQELGATASEAELLQKQSIDMYLGKPGRFQSMECRDGGEYDLDLSRVGNFPH